MRKLQLRDSLMHSLFVNIILCGSLYEKMNSICVKMADKKIEQLYHKIKSIELVYLFITDFPDHAILLKSLLKSK